MNTHPDVQSQQPSPSIPVIYQSPNDLALAMLGDNLPVSLTILAQNTLTINRWRFEFNIIGESHLVTVLYDGGVVARELLACVPLAPETCMSHHVFSDLNDFAFANSRQAVAVRFVMIPLSAEALNHHLQAYPAPELEVVFPAVLGCIPLTRIWWNWDNNRVYWRTLHIYPTTDACVLVHSESHFSLNHLD